MTVRPKTIKLLEGNISSQLLGSGFGDDFLNLISKAQATRAEINKWGCIKLSLKLLLHSEGNSQQSEKAAYAMGENIYQ